LGPKEVTRRYFRYPRWPFVNAYSILVWRLIKFLIYELYFLRQRIQLYEQFNGRRQFSNYKMINFCAFSQHLPLSGR